MEDVDRETAWKLREGPYPVNASDLEYMYEAIAADYGWTSGELRELDDSLRRQTTREGIRAHKLPPALAHLTSDDPLGDRIERSVPDGVAMVEAWPGADGEPIPPAVRERSRAALAALVGADVAN